MHNFSIFFYTDGMSYLNLNAAKWEDSENRKSTVGLKKKAAPAQESQI